MTNWTLAARSLRYHWRSHLGVLLGAILSAAILAGALAVGDSVRYSLRRMALQRLGAVYLALNGQSRLFRAALADDLSADLGAPAAPAILLRGTAAAAGGEPRSGHVQVLGVDERFWKVGGVPPPRMADGVVLNEKLARKLGARAGDEVVLRVEKPSQLSRDAPLSTVEDADVTLRLTVSAVQPDDRLGRFSLEANQVPPFNAFVPLTRLQREIAAAGRANVLLVGTKPVKPVTTADAGGALRSRWTLADAGLELRPLPDRGELDLRTDRIFLEPAAAQAGQSALPGSRGILTYFVNELRVGDRATPYSMVSALGAPIVPPEMRDDEVLINQWLADDLHAKPGDTLKIAYFVVGAMRKVEERKTTFRVRAVVPLAGVYADRNLMPPFPGVANAENCRDWTPGIPVDLTRIRKNDEAYWHAYRGTPKAFITLRAGQRLWDNRFGNLTAIRYPAAGETPQAAAVKIGRALDPASVGLFFLPVRQQALAASSQSMDFGALFLGFSMFLIAAALLLTALLFALGVEQRAEEVGILLALGFPPVRVRRLLLLEGALIALLASAVGGGLGVLYTRAVVHGLSTVWSGAVAGSALEYHAEPGTLAMGASAGFLAALLSIWLVARRQARAPARELLSAAGEAESALVYTAPRRPWLRVHPRVWATLCVAGALALVGVALGGGGKGEAAGYFFGAGALLLVGGILLCRALLVGLEGGAAARDLTLGSLGVRNSARRRGRSLAAISLLACGTFLVIAIGANRQDARQEAGRRDSGTGGFAFYGESSIPVYQDLNSSAGRDAFGLDAQDMQDVHVVPLRVREGDEASCLNLNRPQSPRILGIQLGAMSGREVGAFRFGWTGWRRLSEPQPDGAIPAAGDVNTVEWALGKGVGSALDVPDDHGGALRLRIVAMLPNSILQGGLLISEENFIRAFPSESGYRVFLIDAPLARAAQVSAALGRALEDVGLDLTPAAERLADFNTVENTYLSIFAILGGLGLLLGSLGLGIVVLRNVLERRGELALLRAVGFGPRALRWLVFSEHSLLLGLGLLVGVVAALLAVLPALDSPGADVPYRSLAATLAAIVASGFLWTWAATAIALRGPLLSALRNE